VAEPDWLQILASRLERGDDLAGVGGRLVESNHIKLADRWRTKHMPQHWGAVEIYNPSFLFGNNNLFRKKALMDAGWYNEKLRTNFEDVAMSENLQRNGYALLYEPSAIVHHLRQDTVLSVLRANWKWRFFGYRNDIDLKGLFRGLYHERLSELARFLLDDLQSMDAIGFTLSCVAVGYAVARDISYLMQHYGERRFYDPTVSNSILEQTSV
jgi:GT2 family glycosyltransferase